MSETLLNIIIIFSVLGAGLLLALIGWGVYYISGTKKRRKNNAGFN